MATIVNLDALDDTLRKRVEMIESARRLRRSETPSELRLWTVLRGRKLGGVKFRRQQPIGPFVVDFFASSARLVVEIDGSVHVGQEAQDAERQRIIESAGYRFVRVTAKEVMSELTSVLARIGDALGIPKAGSALTPGPSPSDGSRSAEPGERGARKTQVETR